MIEILLPLVVIALLVAANGVFVAAEFALVATRKSRLQTLADNGSGAARWLLALIAQPTGKDRYIAIAQLGITLASIGLGMYGEPALAGFLYGPLQSLGLPAEATYGISFFIALGFVVFLHVVFGEMIPKALALQQPEATSIASNLFMRSFGLLMRPLVVMLNWMAMSMMRLLGIREPDKSMSLYTSEELAIVTEETAQHGQLNSVQQRLIDTILQLEDRTAEELMTSRSRLDAIEVDTSVDELVHKVVSSPLSRYPVYDSNLDDVIGVLHVKDFIRARARGVLFGLRELVRPLPSVAAAASAEDLLRLFKRGRVHAALVVDEFGGTLGFVTMDDLTTEVIDSEDSVDTDWIRRNVDGSFSVDGEVTLGELGETLEIEIEREDVVTAAGLFLVLYGVLPKSGAQVKHAGYLISVEEMQGYKITRLHIARLT